jgi:ATP-dependent Clp protease ATP-binding subunit ClpX
MFENMGIDDNVSLNPQPLLLIGATGSGKSYLVKRATEFVQIHCSFVSATSLVQTGYVGTSIDKAIESHYFRCGKNVKQAERSIIFIDEIDKIRSQASSGEPDVSGEGVQNALLTLFDGRPVTVSENGHSDSSNKVDLNTSGILFICTGAFAAGLPDLIRTRLNHTGKDHLSDAEILSLVQTEDLVKFGFIPEFIGRFGSLVTLEPLSTDDLVSILVEAKDSVLQKHKTLFAMHGIDLEFTPEALAAIASQAMKLQTGARGLNRIVKDCLWEWEFQLPELAEAGVSQITIDQYALWEGQPSFKYSDSDRKASLRDRNQKLRQLQQLTIPDEPPIKRSSILVDGKTFTNTAGWSDLQIREKLKEVKSLIGWSDTAGSAKKWWEAFEGENQQRMALVLRLAEELLWRKATITEFFLAYVYSNTDNIQANLSYLDYTRLKKEEERRKREELRQRQEQEQQHEKEEELRQPQEQQIREQTANSSYRVVLTEVPSDRKIAVLKVVRELTGLSLKEAKDLIESIPPITVYQGVSAETAQNYVQKLVKVGVRVTVQPEG